MEDGQELVIDTTGVGTEAALRQAEALGSEVLVRLRRPSSLTVEVGGQPILRIDRSPEGVRIDLGPDAGERVILGDSFRNFLNQWLESHFDAHTHTLPDGNVTTPPAPGFAGVRVGDQLLSKVTRVR